MYEALVALAVFLAVAGLAVVLAVFDWPTLLLSGFWLVGAGFSASLMASVLYHWALRRSLLSRGGLPARWWLNPTRQHHLLGPERRRVVPYFYFGVAAFLVTMVGCLGILLAALKSWDPGR